MFAPRTKKPVTSQRPRSRGTTPSWQASSHHATSTWSTTTARTSTPVAPDQAGLFELQRVVGNRAVRSLLSAPGLVQRHAIPGAPASATPQTIAARGTRGSGGPLPYLARIQASFGRHDVSQVQAFTGRTATEAAEELRAQAFTFGDHIAFASLPDLRTAAHEAAHVVQQRSGVHLAGGIDRPGDSHEQHADAVADAVVAGRSAERLLDALGGGRSTAASSDPIATARAGTSAGCGEHLDLIHASFGHHDVSGVDAVVGGTAADASVELGPNAFAVDNAIGFSSSPDLVVAGRSAEPSLNEASLRRHSAPAANAPPEVLAVQRQPSSQKENNDPDANVSLGVLDHEIFGAGTTSFTVMRELLRGIVGGFRSMPADQRDRILAKFANLDPEAFGNLQLGYLVGILEGLGLGLKGLGEAVITLVTLPFKLHDLVFETVPELIAKYGPRFPSMVEEARRLSVQLSQILSDPALRRELSESLQGWANARIRSIGHGIAEKIIGLLAESWFDFGRDVGKIVGQVLFEVILAVLSGAIANVVKEAGYWIARLAKGGVEVFRALRRLLGDALAWLGKLGGRLSGELAAAFKDTQAFGVRIGKLLEDLAGEPALAHADTGLPARIPDAKVPHVLESRMKTPSGGAGKKVGELSRVAAAVGEDSVSVARAITARIPGELKILGRCDDFAKALEDGLRAEGQAGIRIHMQFPGNARPYSNKFGTLGGTGSYHDAVRVGDTVFDNMRPSGVPFADFEADMGGFGFVTASGGNVTFKPF